MNNIKVLEEVLGLLKTLQDTIGVPQGDSLSDKNILGGDPNDPNTRVKPILTSSEAKRVASIASVFAETFLKIQRKYTKDEKPQTLISQLAKRNKPMAPPAKNEMPKGGMMLAGLLLLLGGVGALIMGLLNDGPMKGALKILSKLGIKGGLKLMFAGLKPLLETLAKFIGKPLAFMGKMFGKGIFGKLLKALKPAMKLFKRIPIIGTLISIGFAISRFKSGDNVGGVIDVLSAVAGLLDLVVPGLGFGLSLGLDVLNAWLDYKAASPENANRSKVDILKDMASAVGDWIWKNALWLPVIGGFKRMVMAWDAFKGGDIMEGLKQFGLGLLSFAGLGPIITGIEMLMGMADSKAENGSLTPNKNWMSKIKDWIKEKMENLPTFLRKPLEWLGILDSDGSSEKEVSVSSPAFESFKNIASGFWGSIKEKFVAVKDAVIKNVKDVFNSFGSFSEFGETVWQTMKDKFGGVFDAVTNGLSVVKDYIAGLGGKLISYVASFFPSGNSKSNELSQEEKDSKTKASGWGTWEEYEKAGWKFKNESAETTNTTVPKTTGNIVVNAPKVSENPAVANAMIEIGKYQIKILNRILNVNIDMLKTMGNLGGNTTQIHQHSSSGGGQQSSPKIPMSQNRNGFTSSPYSLA